MKRVAYYVEGTRIIEWPMSISVTVLSAFLFVWPQITLAPAFRLFSYALPSQFIAITFLVCGVSCIVALLVNGASHEMGPRVRSWAAFGRAMLMFQFGLSTVQASIEQGYPYTVVPFWFTFGVAELWVAYRAVLDVRSPE